MLKPICTHSPSYVLCYGCGGRPYIRRPIDTAISGEHSTCLRFSYLHLSDICFLAKLSKFRNSDVQMLIVLELTLFLLLLGSFFTAMNTFNWRHHRDDQNLELPWRSSIHVRSSHYEEVLSTWTSQEGVWCWPGRQEGPDLLPPAWLFHLGGSIVPHLAGRQSTEMGKSRCLDPLVPRILSCLHRDRDGIHHRTTCLLRWTTLDNLPNTFVKADNQKQFSFRIIQWGWTF